MTAKRGYRFAIVPDWVVFHPDLQPQDIRVFAALDRYANRDRTSWPGLATIGERLGCSEDTVRRAIRRLERVGAVVVVRRYDADDRQTSNEYRLAGDAPMHTAPSTGATPDPGTDARGRVAPVLPEREPLNESQKNEQTAPSALFDAPDLFDEFWSAYPRRKEKQAARTKWASTLTRGVDPQTLITAATNYARSCQIDQTQERYMKHPATFLGPTEPWRDHLEPVEEPTGFTPSDSYAV